MKKAILIVVVLVAVAGIVLVSRHDNAAPAGSDTTKATSSAPTTTDASQAVATDTVTITNFKFSPAVIKVKKGTTVHWTNKDGVAHTVTADSGTGPQSGNLADGATYSFTYTQTGSFSYHCNIHDEMKGTVIVTE
jgi:plastocyanin